MFSWFVEGVQKGISIDLEVLQGSHPSSWPFSHQLVVITSHEHEVALDAGS